ncbi:hypothetical protein BH09ACT7_BH09ACT7_08400 [soil metagenome]
MAAVVLLDEESSPPCALVNVAFDCLSGSTAFVLTLAQLDDLVAALTGAQQAFDDDEHVGGTATS